MILRSLLIVATLSVCIESYDSYVYKMCMFLCIQLRFLQLRFLCIQDVYVLMHGRCVCVAVCCSVLQSIWKLMKCQPSCIRVENLPSKNYRWTSKLCVCVCVTQNIYMYVYNIFGLYRQYSWSQLQTEGFKPLKSLAALCVSLVSTARRAL